MKDFLNKHLKESEISRTSNQIVLTKFKLNLSIELS